ncbi:hypothetical protein P152DRAFT_388889 [Eremomyces bilateralis CBS 781.70]|uniref:Glycerate dehydrogenase n=1 Tax=Eremomyces bilateralis CBS 781.70 TaxID=1392243 RepID=A0A6G1GEM6_9PEZI|nr:uncharacterized protein P152DRAFT_388889 [Eremomyces bilateralis CBS 781.70]KAF1816366.1 hypothetical protein P152DRAFT_388889 [Eremomyces bilateralis CBS 781.70]
MHHHIVGLEEIHTPYPTPSFPHPYTQTNHHTTSPSELRSRIADATILIATTVKLTADILRPSVTPRLRHIAVMASGTDHVDLTAAQARGIRVTNTPGVMMEAVAEHAVGLYFAARRRIVRTMDLSVGRATEWKTRESVAGRMHMADGGAPLTCREEVVGVVGWGKIGREIGRLMSALGMRVVVAGRKGATGGEVGEGRVEFEEVLRTCTVVVLVVPRKKETTGLIGERELGMMRKEAVIVNVARGGIVDEEAMVKALRDGTISGYATDVFRVEPADEEDTPILSEEIIRNEGLNITATPHVAWYGDSTQKNLNRVLKENIEKWVRGEDQNIIV